MAKFMFRVPKVGDWAGASQALNWLNRGLEISLRHAMKEEAEFITKEIKENLASGGSPGFKPIRPFTKAVRRALGMSGIRPGVASGQVLQAIKAHRIGKYDYFCGVKRGQKHKTPKGHVVDVADVALRLEMGRKKFILELDKAGPSGKTPRQWLWWLYLSGAIQAPPNKKTLSIQIGKAPPRPFVGQVADREMNKIPQRITQRLEKEFLRIAGSL